MAEVCQIRSSSSQTARLTEILLQQPESGCLLSHYGHQQLKAYRIPSEKVAKLLDGIIQGEPGAAQALQEAFPMLHFMKDRPVNTAPSGRTKSALAADYFGYFN